MLDQGPLFETGGSTSHAPGLAFQTNGSRMMCRIAQDSVALYATFEADGEPCWYGVGGIEVATTEARMQELKRRLGFARSYGLEGAELLTPAEAAERVPLLDPSTILGAYHVPSDGIAKGVRIASALGRRATSDRGVAFEGGVTVTGFDVRDGRVHGVRTDRGDVECERVLLCAGIWGPSVGALAGVPVPLVAVQHQLVWTDPVPGLEGESREVAHPILRHQDMAMYFRHREDHYAVGNYKHEPIATPQAELRRPGEDALMPSLMPFTPRDFGVAEAEAARLLPALKGRMRPADPSRSINGMFSFTPDAGSIVGESATVRGFWLCEAVWVTHAGGFGRLVAEWMQEGEPSVDMAEADANRFYPYMTTPPFVLERGKQQYREVYDIIHPRQQMARPRKLRLSPFYRRQVELGAEFVVGAGWERPEWYETNAALVPDEAPWLERDPWAARFWSPIEGAEHLATGTPPRSSTSRRSRSSTCRGRMHSRSSSACSRTGSTGPSGRSSTRRRSPARRHPPRPHDHAEGRRAVPRGDRRRERPARHRLAQAAPPRRRARPITERTGSLFALGLWGPNARTILEAVTDVDVSNDAFPYMTARYLNLGEVGPVWAQRISYAGELGWELYGQFAMGDRAWELLWGAGRDHGLVAAGLGCSTRSGSRRATGSGARTSTPSATRSRRASGSPSGWTRTSSGARGARRAARTPPKEKLACLTLDDPGSVVLGREPIRADGVVVGYVTSAGYGYTVGCCIAYGYLPAELAVPGTAVEIEYFDERLPPPWPRTRSGTRRANA